MKETDYSLADSLVHDREMAEALGHMMIAWSRTEAILQILLREILQCQEYVSMAIFYRLPTFEAKTKIMQSLLTTWKPRDCDAAAIGKIIEKLSSMSLTRNSWVHGTWLIDELRTQTLVAAFRKGVERKRAKANDIIQHRNGVTALADSILDELYKNKAPKPLSPPSQQSDDLPRPRVETLPLRKDPDQSSHA